MYSSMLLSVFAASALGQAITFSNTTFTKPAVVGSTWPISFSEGSGDDVAIAFGNSTYGFQVVDGLTAPGMYPWQVAVPVDVVAGIYQLALIQGDADPVYSPSFSLEIPADQASSTTDAPTTNVPFPTTATTTTTETTTVTAIFLPGPTGLIPAVMNGTNATMPPVTYIYWEEECGCHHTSTCDYTALPTSMSSTTVTYSAEDCGCTKTIEAPCAETAIPVAVAPTAAPVPPPAATAATNMPAAPAATTSAAPVAPMATTAPAPFTGGAAGKLAASSLGFLALGIALVMA